MNDHRIHREEESPLLLLGGSSNLPLPLHTCGTKIYLKRWPRNLVGRVHKFKVNLEIFPSMDHGHERWLCVALSSQAHGARR